MASRQREDGPTAQQIQLAEFGNRVLATDDLEYLLNEASRVSAESLGVEYVKVLEWRPATGDFLLRAGYGWEEELIGRAIIPGDSMSPAGQAIMIDQPVTSNDLDRETRFSVPELLRSHNIKSAANVIIRVDGEVFGVFEADNPTAGEFDERDSAFLQGAANLLGLAVERHRLSEERAALAARNELLLRELRHRTANNLQSIQALIQLQRHSHLEPEAAAALDKLLTRIEAMCRVTSQLNETAALDSIDLKDYLSGLLGHLVRLGEHNGARVALKLHLAPASVHPDRALAIGLIVSEFVTNSVKHAFQGGYGEIAVRLQLDAQDIHLHLGDNGPGLMVSADQPRSRGLGVGLISMLAAQIGGTAEWRNENGAVLHVRFSIEDERPG